MWHAPAVHGYNSDFKIVMMEEGEEALFPSASARLIVPRARDADRREYSEFDKQFRDHAKTEGIAEAQRLQVKKLTVVPPHEKWTPTIPGLVRFVPKPFKEYGIGKTDVVLCARRRDYGPTKNWAHWRDLASALRAQGLTYITAGAPDSTEVLPGASTTEYPRFLDATLEAMHNTKLVVATDNGLAHLAVLAGRPLLLITDDGMRTAPGYVAVKIQRFHAANHTGSPLHIAQSAWNSINPVLSSIITLVSQS
jgi:ADP-heptose:LPS heptosyltransferase